MRSVRSFAAAGLLAALIGLGCSGGTSFAPVSGIITIDGKPYGKAVVSFQPIGGPENPNPGRGSSSYTDESGRFVLHCDDGNDGAVVGKHLIRIMTRGNNVLGQDPNGSSDDGAPAKREVDPIPPEWNATSVKEFVVPAGGTDKADFDIVTKKAAKK